MRKDVIFPWYRFGCNAGGSEGYPGVSAIWEKAAWGSGDWGGCSCDFLRGRVFGLVLELSLPVGVVVQLEFVLSRRELIFVVFGAVFARN